MPTLTFVSIRFTVLSTAELYRLIYLSDKSWCILKAAVDRPVLPCWLNVTEFQVTVYRPSALIEVVSTACGPWACIVCSHMQGSDREVNQRSLPQPERS